MTEETRIYSYATEVPFVSEQVKLDYAFKVFQLGEAFAEPEVYAAAVKRLLAALS